MDAMLLGETITVAPNAQYVGDWMPSGGNRGLASFQVFLVSATGMAVGVETKQTDEDDPAPLTSVVGLYTGAISAVGKYDFELANAEDLVRYAIKNVGGSDVTIHLMFAEPSWVPN